MEFVTEKHGNTLLVRIAGDLDLQTSPQFRTIVEHELEHYPYLKNLLLDFHETTFVDSSGLGVILGRFKQVSQKGGKLSAVRVPSQLTKLFELSGLMKIMEIFPSMDDAMAKL